MNLSSLPPGCRVSDIPGNRPEDAMWESFCDELRAAVGVDLSDEQFAAVYEIVQRAHATGVAEARPALEAVHSWWCDLPDDYQTPDHDRAYAAIAAVRAALRESRS